MTLPPAGDPCLERDRDIDRVRREEESGEETSTAYQ